MILIRTIHGSILRPRSKIYPPPTKINVLYSTLISKKLAHRLGKQKLYANKEGRGGDGIDPNSGVFKF